MTMTSVFVLYYKCNFSSLILLHHIPYMIHNMPYIIYFTSSQVGFVPLKYLSRGLSATSLAVTGGTVFSLRVIPRYTSPLVVKVTIARQDGGGDGGGGAILRPDVYYWSTQELDLFEKQYRPGAEEQEGGGGRGGGRDDEAALEELLEDNEEVTLPYLIAHDLQCESWVRDALLVRTDLYLLLECFIA